MSIYSNSSLNTQKIFQKAKREKRMKNFSIKENFEYFLNCEIDKRTSTQTEREKLKREILEQVIASPFTLTEVNRNYK